MLKGLVALAVLVVLVVGARVLRRPATAPPVLVPVVDGRFVLRYPKRNAVMLGITALFPTGLVIALTLRASALGRASTPGVVIAAIVSLAGVAFALYEFVSAFRACIVIDDTGIERVGVVAHRRVSWRDVARIAHNPQHRWFYVTTHRGNHLWISDELAGIAQFSDLALRRLPPAVLRQAGDVREILEELAEPARA